MPTPKKRPPKMLMQVPLTSLTPGSKYVYGFTEYTVGKVANQVQANDVSYTTMSLHGPGGERLLVSGITGSDGMFGPTNVVCYRAIEVDIPDPGGDR